MAVSITGSDPSLSVIGGSASFGSIIKNDTVRSANHITVQVSDTVTTGRILSADLTITAAGYSAPAKLYFEVEPANERMQYDLGGNRIHFTITNYGTYGLALGSFYPHHGIGFRVDASSYNDIYESGFMVATGPSYVSDGVRNAAGEPDGDFAVVPGGNLAVSTPGSQAAQESVARFNDSRAEQPLGVEIELHTYAFDDAGYDDFLILQYIIRNTSVYDLVGLEVGQYFDWDPVNFVSDAGGWRAADSAAWVAYNSGGVKSNYRGIRVVDGPLSSVWTANATVSTYFGDGFTETEKWNALTSGFTTATTFADAAYDITQLVSVGPLTIAPGAVDTVAFAVLIGATGAEFSAASAAAKDAYDNRVLPCCVGIRGNVDDDPAQAINVSDLTYLVAALFTGGPQPACPEEGNVNGDVGNAINVSDLTYLISALYLGGPLPPPCGTYAR